MYKLLSTESRVIDVEMALDMISKNTYAHQRGIRPWRVNDIADKIESGEFTGGHIVFGVNGTGTYIVDGQHTLSAIIKTGIPTLADVKKFKCETDADLSLLWQQFDGGLVRSLKDYVKSEAGALGVDWPARRSSLIAGAAAVAMHGPIKKDLTKRKKTSLLKLFLNEGEFINDLIGTKGISYSFLERQHVVAVMMLSYRVDIEDAWRFWSAVKTGEMLQSSSPAYHLRNFLLTNFTTGSSSKASRTATPREFYVRCAKAWNFFRKGTRVKYFKYSPLEPIPSLV